MNGERPFPRCWVLPHIRHHKKETAVLGKLVLLAG
jgi:hypothetical protein